MTEFDRQALLAHQDLVRRIARRLVYDPQEVDEVVQETWAAGLRQEQAPGRGWLARTVRNIAQTRARAGRRRRLREQAAARPGTVPSTSDVVAKAELQQQVVDAVLALPEPYRTTILLRYYENLPPRQIALRTGAPVATVKTRLERGHRKLREGLDRRHGSRQAWMGALLALLASRALAGTGATLMAKKTLGAAAVLIVMATTVHLATRERGSYPPEKRAPRTGETVPRRSGQAGGPPAPATALFGRVIDRNGRAVAGARIQRLTAASSPRHFFGPPALDRLRAGWEQARVLLSPHPDAVADKEGRFSLPAGTGRLLLVRAKGFLTRRSAVQLAVPIVLESRPYTMGTVLAPNGRPLPGARVQLLAAQSQVAGGALALARVVTGPDGRFGFPDEATGSDLLVEHPRHPPLFYNLSQLRTREVTVRLTEWKTLRGVVLDAASRAPVAGAEVYAASYAALPPWTTKSEADGTFELRHGAPAPYCSVVVDAGPRGNRMVQVDTASDAPIEVLLRPTVSVRGRVTGPPPEEIAGLRVYSSQENHFTREARTDAWGKFVLEGLAADARLYLLFDPWHKTWEPEQAAPRPGDRGQGALPPPFPPELMLRLKRKAGVSGTVVDLEGRPVPGAVLDCREGFSHAFGAMLLFTYPRVARAITDAQGRFRLTGVTTRFPKLPISVKARGFVLGRLDLSGLQPGRERSGELVRLSRGEAITGQVVFADGRPAGGFKVVAGRRSEAGGMPPFDYLRSSATTDQEGRYRIGTLPPGRYSVSVRTGNDYLPARRYRVVAGGGCEPLVLTRGQRLAGRVADEQGRPLAGVAIAVQTLDYREASRVRTGADGTFVAAQLKPGRYHLYFWRQGYLGHYERDIAVPRTEPLVVTLGKGRSIRGLLLGADGRPRGGVLLRAERTAPPGPPGGSSGQAFTGHGGQFEISGLSEGEYRLTPEQQDRSHGDSFRPVEKVAAGSEITLRAIKGTFLEVRIVDPLGAPVLDAWLSVIAEEQKGGIYRAFLEKKGAVYRAGPLLGERFTLLARRGAEYGFVEGVPSGAGAVTVVLGRGASIAGRLVDPDGKPARGNIALTLKRLPHHTIRLTVRGTDGRFRFTGLPGGEYWIRATPPNSHAVGPGGRTVRAGATDLELLLPPG